MKTLQKTSGSASKIPFPTVSHELVAIATLSALGWSISLFVAATIFLAFAGPSDLGAEIAALAAIL